MLKLHVVLTLLIVAINFIGCGRQSGTMPQEQTKVVKFESTPEGATVFVDDNYVVRAPADIALTVGKHNVIFDKDGYERYTLENVEVKKDTTEIKVVLKKIEDVNIIKSTETKLSETLLKHLQNLFLHQMAYFTLAMKRENIYVNFINVQGDSFVAVGSIPGVLDHNGSKEYINKSFFVIKGNTYRFNLKEFENLEVNVQPLNFDIKT